MGDFQTHEHDVLVIGAGGAGLRAAIGAAAVEGCSVGLVCKSLLGKAHTVMAEGGVAAAMANVDPSLREAARNLGARGWRLFRTVTLPLILPGWFAGASIVFIWSFTDLGTPLIFGFSHVVPVRIFDSISELNTNPSGYALVMLVLLMTAVIFLLTKRLFAVRRHEMMSRGHTGDGEHRATTRQTVLIWLGVGAVLALALLPHVAVVAHGV